MGRLIVLIAIVLLAFSCAQVGLPTGGEKDVTPPQVLSATPSLGQTNIPTTPGGMVSFEFDEYVNVRQLSAQLLVSPPLQKPVEWVMKGQTVYFFWSEELQKDKTYIFQFGDAIVDLNEGNAASELMHAFSTGAQMDTLSISGSVVDVFSNEKQKGKRVFVYDWDVPVDSILTGSLPQFVTSTDDDGAFKVSYMPEGEYRLLSIDDVDRNYVWTDGEALALCPNKIVLTKNDTLENDLLMQKTHDIDVKYFVGASRDSLGLIKMELSGELGSIDEIEAPGLEKHNSGTDLWIWGHPIDVDPSTIIWKSADTLVVADEEPIDLVDFKFVKGPEGKQVSGSTAKFEFSRPVTFLKPNLMKLTRGDSVEVEIKGVAISEENPFEIEVEASFGRGDVVEFTMLPGSVEGQGRQFLSDTLKSKWSTFKLSELSELVVSVDAEGWLELISANGTVVKVVDLERGMEPLRFKNLTPGSYALRWLGDPNSNGMWDGVSLEDWRLPEPARVMPSNIKVRADWTHEVSWDVYE
ncbi:MAG: hypothetical protein CMB32_06340 [Euryarchaeota archaeon]|nr:hypothetical protein [Euryarchaeota archaeon]